jgi:hypothetical protein
VSEQLPEVTLLYDGRGDRRLLVRAGGLVPPPLLYAGLSSFLGHGEINRKDVRNVLKGRPDREILGTFKALVHHNLLRPTSKECVASYAVLSVRDFED